MISHEEARALISARLDGPLDPVANRELLLHLQSCDTCQHFAEQMNAMAEGLRSIPMLPASPHVRREVLEQIQAGPGWRRQFRVWWSRIAPAPAIAVVATLILVLVVGTTLFNNGELPLGRNGDNDRTPTARSIAIGQTEPAPTQTEAPSVAMSESDHEATRPTGPTATIPNIPAEADRATTAPSVSVPPPSTGPDTASEPTTTEEEATSEVAAGIETVAPSVVAPVVAPSEGPREPQPSDATHAEPPTTQADGSGTVPSPSPSPAPADTEPAGDVVAAFATPGRAEETAEPAATATATEPSPTVTPTAAPPTATATTAAATATSTMESTPTAMPPTATPTDDPPTPAPTELPPTTPPTEVPPTATPTEVPPPPEPTATATPEPAQAVLTTPPPTATLEPTPTATLEPTPTATLEPTATEVAAEIVPPAEPTAAPGGIQPMDDVTPIPAEETAASTTPETRGAGAEQPPEATATIAPTEATEPTPPITRSGRAGTQVPDEETPVESAETPASVEQETPTIGRQRGNMPTATPPVGTMTPETTSTTSSSPPIAPMDGQPVDETPASADAVPTAPAGTSGEETPVPTEIAADGDTSNVGGIGGMEPTAPIQSSDQDRGGRGNSPAGAATEVPGSAETTDLAGAEVVTMLPESVMAPGPIWALDQSAFAIADPSGALVVGTLGGGASAFNGVYYPRWTGSGQLLVAYYPSGASELAVGLLDPSSGNIEPISAPTEDGSAPRDVPAGELGGQLYYQRSWPTDPGRGIELHRAGADGDQVLWSVPGVTPLGAAPFPTPAGTFLMVTDQGWYAVDGGGGAINLGGSVAEVTAVAFGGETMAYLSGGTISIASSGSPGSITGTIATSGQAGFDVAPGGQYLAVADGATVAIYDVTGNVVASFSDASGSGYSAILWGTDGLYVTRGGNQPAIIRIAAELLPA